MTELISVVAVAGYTVAYLATGMRYAGKPYVTRAVQARCERLPSLADDRVTVEGWRREAAFEALFVTAIWPVYLTFRALVTRVAASAPLSEAELRRQLADRDRRITELERELGVDRSPA